MALFVKLCLLATLTTCVLGTGMKSNARLSGHQQDRVHSRVKRQTTVELSGDDIAQIVDKHNEYRAMEGSSNMERLRWNTVLAQMAQDWANRCVWEHGNPYYANQPYPQIGQNNYANTANPYNLADAIFAWYDEKQFYNYDTGDCVPGEMCGHYTQVVWADTEEVGCGIKLCGTLVNTGLNNAWFLVCNYGTSGNWGGEYPFKKGSECTQCKSGHAWCTDGLCNTDNCNWDTPNCECKAACQNCGTYNAADCSCTCPDGWNTADCSELCQNNHPDCGANPGWPSSWCTGNDYSGLVYRNCPALCDQCVHVTPEEQDCPFIDGPNGQVPAGCPKLLTSPIVLLLLASVIAVFIVRLNDILC